MSWFLICVILRISCVSSWFFFIQLYHDAAQQNIKTGFVAYFRCWNLLFQNPTNWLWSTSNVEYGPYLSRLSLSCNLGIVQH
jgi:hypothetical protein